MPVGIRVRLDDATLSVRKPVDSETRERPMLVHGFALAHDAAISGRVVSCAGGSGGRFYPVFFCASMWRCACVKACAAVVLAGFAASTSFSSPALATASA